MMPLSTSPVPAVARRASPSATTRTAPVGRGDDGGRALEEHDGARSLRRATARAAEAVGAGPAAR